MIASSRNTAPYTSATPGARLNERVTAGNWPWWLIVSGAVLLLKRATVLIGTWTGQLDKGQCAAVLAGERPFDEATMVDDDHGHPGAVTADADGTPREYAGSTADR